MEFLQKNARTVVIALLAIGVITVVATSSSNETEDNDSEKTSEVVTSEGGEQADNEGEDGTNGSGESSETEKTQSVEKNDNEFTISAELGDSQTVLVRRIIGEYVDSSGEIPELSAEQMLFVETNLVNTLPRNEFIEVGDTIRLEESAVGDIIGDSLTLSEPQIAAWGKYL